MPHVIVKLWPGRSEQQKTRLAAAITKNVMGILYFGEESVSAAMEEVKSQDWVEKVYGPDVKGKWANSTRSPDTTRVTSEFVASRKCMEGTENEGTSRRTYLAFSFCWSLIAGSDEYSESIDILDNQDHAKRLAAVKPRVCSILHRVRTGSATVSC